MSGDILAWNRTHLQAFIDNKGSNKSSNSGGDSDATGYDPRINAELFRIPRKSSLPLLIRDNNGLTKDHARSIRFMVMSMYCLATETDHKSKLIIFGRDMYPFLAMRETVGHKFRGKWHYAEGISREIVSKFRGEYSGYNFGVDTGFNGTIPHVALETDQNNKIRLLSSDSNEKRILQWETFNNDYYINIRNIRSCVVDLEHMPKPFMRCNETEKVNGIRQPILRNSCQADILYAARVWDYAAIISEHYFPAFREMLEMTDVYQRTDYIINRLSFLKKG